MLIACNLSCARVVKSGWRVPACILGGYTMNLSDLRPAEGSKQSNNFRRGRGHGSGNGKTAGKDIRDRKHVQVHHALALKVDRCHFTGVSQREVLQTAILKT